MPTISAGSPGRFEAVTDPWWSSVHDRIEADQYLVAGDADPTGSFVATNPRHKWRARFTHAGVSVAPLRALAGSDEQPHERPSEPELTSGTNGSEAPAWSLGLRLVEFGTSDALVPVPTAHPHADGDRVELAYGAADPANAPLVEWYVNDARGIEHGFIVREAQLGTGPLTLALAVTGGWQAEASADGTAVDLRSGVAHLRYAGLHVFDATGRTLQSRLDVPAEDVAAIHVVVDTVGATYPVTIDPVLTAASPTLDGQGSDFAASVAGAGDVNGDGYGDVVVGAPGALDINLDFVGSGSAYLFLGGPTGLSAIPARTWTGETNADGFGAAVASAGDVNGDGYADVIVGARAYDNDRGRVYVYLGGPTGAEASPAATLTGQANEGFGTSVASAGDIDVDGYSDLAIGGPRHDTARGNVYVVFGRSNAAGLVIGATLSGNAQGDEFGYQTTGAGDVNGDGFGDVIVGAPGASSERGVVHVFLGSSGGLQTPAATTMGGESSGDRFGRSVAAAGDVNGDGYGDAIVGAPRYDADDRGRGYLFLGAALGLATSATSVVTGEASNNYLGASSRGAGDLNGDGYADVVIGAAGYGSSKGRTYVHLGGPAGLSGNPTLMTGESTPSSYGIAVDAAGDINGDGYADIVVGATSANSGLGRAYLYLGGVGSLATASSPTLTGEPSSYLGMSLRSAGDVNGDGYADVIVGAYSYDNARGRAYLFLGGPAGLAATAAATLTGEGTNHGFGYSVDSAGDVNGDGYGDIVIGAPYYGSLSGRAYVYLGGAAGLTTTPHRTWTGSASAQLGFSVAAAGDVNRDGYADVVVGALGYNGTPDRVYVFHGGASGIASTPNATLSPEVSGSGFGSKVAGAGDVNRDGYGDVVVGASGFDNNRGRAYVHFGSAGGLMTTASVVLTGQATSDYFGIEVATAGDVNGDGYAEVIVGASRSAPNAGRAYLYNGGPTGTSTSVSAVLEGLAGGDGFSRVRGAGDINGDGYADIAVGAQYYLSWTGIVRVFLGGAGGLSQVAHASFEGESTSNSFGFSLAGADVNGDGYADLVIGAPAAASGAGRVYVYAGNGHGGLSVRPRARRTDDSAPIAHGGHSNSQSAFRLNAVGRSPYGRGRVKLEWEVKPLGTAFSGTGLGQSPTWTDTQASGVDLSALVNGLTFSTMYHWRVRVRYHPASAPATAYSRWSTQPWSGWQQASIATQINQPPIVTSVSVTGTLRVGQLLAGSFQYSDAEGDPAGTATYRWRRGGVPIVGATDATYVVTQADSGQTVTFEVAPVAATGASPGIAVSTTAGVVLNSPPTATNVSVAGVPVSGRTLTGAYTFGDVDGDAAAAPVFRWLRDGVAIEGESGATFTLGAADVGRRIAFEVTPAATTGASPGVAVTSADLGSHLSYFAEGATNAFFSTTLALLNPNANPATVRLHFDRDDGARVTHDLTIGVRTRATVPVKTVAGMQDAQFATTIESDQPLVVDRTMTWDDGRYGSHAETSMEAPATTWYLAEGATHSGFDLFYLVQNPRSTPVTLHVRYLLPAGTPIEQDYVISAQSRFNIWVNRADPALASTDVSAVLTASAPVIVERAMYLTSGGRTFGAGHESAGVTTPATQWFLAEGATGSYFDLFVLVANATTTDALVQATYLLPDGTAVERTHTVGANSRFNIWVDQEDAQLADTAVSTVLTSINGVPVVVERSMWWPAAAWAEAHNSSGLTATGARWALAEGEVGGPNHVETFILIVNRGGPESATVTLYYEDGTSENRTFALPGSSRTNVSVAAEFPGAADKRFGAVVSATNPAARLAVERAMYSDANGARWAAGTNAVATRLP